MSGRPVLPADSRELEAHRVTRRIARPRLWQYDYLMLKEIAAALGREAAALDGKGGLDILDVGCKYRPYRGLFASRCARYVGLDREGYWGIQIRGDATRLPFRSDSFDLVLCTQAFYLLANFREALGEFTRVCRRGGRILLTTIGVWPYPPAVRLHRWSRRELEEVLSEFGSARVEESGGLLALVPQLANATLAMGVEADLVRRHRWLGRAAALPLKAIYLSLNLAAVAGGRLLRATGAAGSSVARSLRELDSHLAINYLAVVSPRK